MDPVLVVGPADDGIVAVHGGDERQREVEARAVVTIAFGDVVYGPLHDLVGGSVVRELCLTGRQVDAREALALRLVSTVAPRDELLAAAMRYAAMITQAPRDILVRTKARSLAEPA